MSYPKVLALLDAQLERLRAAREILSSGSESNQEAKDFTHLPEILTPSGKPNSEVGTNLPHAAVEPTRVAPRQRRERRVVVRRRKQEDPGALGSAVPNAPVYVSADKVQSGRTGRGSTPAVPKQEEQLSPELLARRWFQSAAH